MISLGSSIAQRQLTHSGGKRVVHCPERVSDLFRAAREVITNEQFDLTVSLRSHLAEDVIESHDYWPLRELHLLVRKIIRSSHFKLRTEELGEL